MVNRDGKNEDHHEVKKMIIIMKAKNDDRHSGWYHKIIVDGHHGVENEDHRD